MSNEKSNNEITRNWLTKLGLSREFLWQILFAWCLMLIFSSIFCLFMEGKSSIDLGFTLWDDRYAKVWTGPMGEIILPQIIFYVIFFLITSIIVAIIITRRGSKQITLALLIFTGILLIIYTACYGTVVLTYLGSRHGPAGWLLLEYPWLSIIIFCLALALGLIGFWIVMSQEIPLDPNLSSTDNQLNRKATYSFLRVWCFRALLIIGMILGSIALVAGFLSLFRNVYMIFITGIVGVISSLALLLFKTNTFPNYPERSRSKEGRSFKIKNLRIFDESPSKSDKKLAYKVNPRNKLWRPFRNVLNCLFIAFSLAFIVAMCYMTVPDEWIFFRFFDLLPWVMIGVLIGIVLMAFLPEPMVYSPLAIFHVIVTYDQFLLNYESPFLPEFRVLNGIFLGFWVSVFIMYHLFTERIKGRGRNYTLMLSSALTFGLVYLILNLVDRFQHQGDMVQKFITEALNVVLPFLLYLSLFFLILFMLLWRADFAYRMRAKEQAKDVSKPEPITKETVAKPSPKKSGRKVKKEPKLSRKKQRAISFALIGIILGSFLAVNMIYVNNSNMPPLLVRNDNFGIWSVSGVTKVEKHFPIQMPAYAPKMDEIEVSAAKGEWEGWHLLISPQPGKTVEVTDVEWSNFTGSGGSKVINKTNMEVFLVRYLVDEQPDRLRGLPDKIVRSAGEHVDLFCRLQVPRNASAGTYESKITLKINGEKQKVTVALKVFDFKMPKDRHIRNAFGGGWYTDEWYDELEYLRITQYDMGIPFTEGEQYWWNSTTKEFEFNWTYYDGNFSEQLARGFTGIRQGYYPLRPEEIEDEDRWEQIVTWFVSNVSNHLDSKKWTDELGEEHSWVEIPYYYWTDEPTTDEYEDIKERNDLYHSGTSKLKTLLTEEYREEFTELHDCVDIWCPVIGNFEPSAVKDRHKEGQDYWFYVCVGPTAPYPNLMLWEAGHNPRLLPLIAARFDVDGFLYWRMTAGDNTYRAGFDGNGDGQIAFKDRTSGRCLPSLRLLSYSAGVEDYEYIWLMRLAIDNKKALNIPDKLISKAEDLEDRLEELVGERPQFVSHDVNELLELREDLGELNEDLWDYIKVLYP